MQPSEPLVEAAAAGHILMNATDPSAGGGKARPRESPARRRRNQADDLLRGGRSTTWRATRVDYYMGRTVDYDVTLFPMVEVARRRA